MTDNRQWTQYQDAILRKIRQQDRVQKWSTIAQKMAEEYGIKGRNGKHCKQRYMEVFDKNNEVLHWDYQSQQIMFMLHTKMGNKWAAIGHQLQNRTDNDVKNHFYSKIRKGLRKVNRLIKTYFKKEFKQIKQTVLYKIIQGSQDRFSDNTQYDQEVWKMCIQTKDNLLVMSYDEEVYNKWENFQKYQFQIKKFIESLVYFSKEFKRKSKTTRRIQEQNQNNNHLQRNSAKSIGKVVSRHNFYDQFESNDYQDSQSQQIQRINKHISCNQKKKNEATQKKVQKPNPVIILKTSGDIQQMIEQKIGCQMIMSMDQNIKKYQALSIPSIPKLIHISSKSGNAMIDQQDQPDNRIEHILFREGLLEEQIQKTNHQFNEISINKGSIKSKGSNFSSYSIEEAQQIQFFGEDNALDQRIYTHGVGGKCPKPMEQSFQKSCKLFRSLQRGQLLYQSFGSQSKRSNEMSIQNNSRDFAQLKQNSLFQSVGR